MAKWQLTKQKYHYYSNGFVKKAVILFENKEENAASSLYVPQTIQFDYQLANEQTKEKLTVTLRRNVLLFTDIFMPQISEKERTYEIDMKKENPFETLLQEEMKLREERAPVDFELPVFFLMEYQESVGIISTVNQLLLKQLQKKYEPVWLVLKQLHSNFMQRQGSIPFHLLIHLCAQVFKSDSPHQKEIPSLMVQLLENKDIYKNYILNISKEIWDEINHIIKDMDLSSELKSKIDEIKTLNPIKKDLVKAKTIEQSYVPRSQLFRTPQPPMQTFLPPAIPPSNNNNNSSTTIILGLDQMGGILTILVIEAVPFAPQNIVNSSSTQNLSSENTNEENTVNVPIHENPFGFFNNMNHGVSHLSVMGSMMSTAVNPLMQPAQDRDESSEDLIFNANFPEQEQSNNDVQSLVHQEENEPESQEIQRRCFGCSIV